MKTKYIIVTLFLLALNVIPAAGMYMEFWPRTYVFYFYLFEAIAFFVISLFPYMKHLVVFFFLLGVLGFVISLTNITVWSGIAIPMTFWTMYSVSWLIYFELHKGSITGPWIKMLPPFPHFMFYLLYMVTSIITCLFATALLFDRVALLAEIPAHFYATLFGLSFAVPTLTIGFLRIIDMIGANHFLHFLFGTYRRPIEKQRVVLFLDMVGSSSMAEQLKARGAMALIARFIFDASSTFRVHGGDIINYTGDGLVVLWPVEKTEKALDAVEALQNKLEKNKARYERDFGMMPDFRIGIHAGRVVISQIGEEKLFLGLYGDTVNTAARLEGLSKKLGTKVIFSQAVKRRLPPERQDACKNMGIQDIRGREEDVEVYTLKKPLKPIGSVPNKE